MIINRYSKSSNYTNQNLPNQVLITQLDNVNYGGTHNMTRV